MSTEDTSPRIRAEQITAIVSSFPFSAAANVINAIIIYFAFLGRAGTLVLSAWVLGCVASTLVAAPQWWRFLKTGIDAASRTDLNRVRDHAVLRAAVWAISPVILLPGSDHDHQLLLQILLCGLAAGGAVGMPTVPTAGIAYVWIIAVGSLVGMALAAGAQENYYPILVGSLWMIYSIYLTRSIYTNAARFVENARNRAEVGAKSEVIGLLLNDFNEHASDWLWEVDEEGRIVEPSRRFCEVCRREADELGLVQLHAFFASTGQGDLMIRGAFERHESFRDVVVDVVVDGEKRNWSLTGRPVRRSDGGFAGYQGVGSDVTDRCIAEARVAYLAETDPVTGLANRAKFSAVLEAALGGDGSPNRAILFCLDLDRFKTVNDTMGHPVGDVLLAEVGRRLCKAVGENWIVARIGGDEFALFLPNDDRPDHASDAAECILSAFEPEFTLDGADFSIGASIGIAIAPDDGATPSDLMKSADLALYRAKAEGRETFRFFEAGMDARADRRRRLEQGLRSALGTDQLQLAYQPILSLHNDRICGFEALARWTSPEFGPVSPGEFIPIAEESNLIIPIGEWILRTAVAAASTWPTGVGVSVNLSPVQFRNRHLLSVIVHALDEAHLTPERLQVEITETTLLDANEATLSILRDLRTLGIRVALDEFGTGYSSLYYLRSFPFDKIKIDRSFVEDIDTNAPSRTIVRSILEMTSALGMRSVVEGVEKRSQLSELRALGCDEIQGYVISAAIENEAIHDFFRKQSWKNGAELTDTVELEIFDDFRKTGYRAWL